MGKKGSILLNTLQLALVIYISSIVLQFSLFSYQLVPPPIKHEPFKHAIQPTYGRLVLMVVDALREDFVHNRSEMAYVKKIIESHEGGSFLAYANTPTVTMPRIKALTTGGIPKFMDVVDNLNSKALLEENIIESFHSMGYKLSLYGDDTWLKMFPSQFSRSDGTTSFFAKDFTQVDDNVTRHLDSIFDPEMKAVESTDWDCTILHYLGLDHIGHQLGPDSPEMSKKLREMDSVFEQIHKSLVHQQKTLLCDDTVKCVDGKPLPTLLLMLSDHGMNAAGNHGGASAEETSAFLMVVPVGTANYALHNVTQNIFQVDLAPTLAMLFGLPIPRNSVGRVIEGLFQDPTVAISANAYQIKELLVNQNIYSTSLDELWKSNPDEFLNQGQRLLLDNSMMAHEEAYQTKLFFSAFILGILTLCFSVRVFYFVEAQGGRILVGILFVHGILLSSSSFIENEHAFWFFAAASYFLYKISRRNGFIVILFGILLPLRVLRERLQIINFAALAHGVEPPFLSTGASALVAPQLWNDPRFVSAFIVFNCFRSASRFRRFSKIVGQNAAIPSAVHFATSVLLLSLKTDYFGVQDTVVGLRLVARQRLALIGGLFLIFWSLIDKKYKSGFWRELLTSGILILFLVLHRSSSVGVLVLADIILRSVDSLSDMTRTSYIEKLLSMWILGQCFFFALGNSHLVSTVDMSGAYTGLNEYHFLVVSSLTLLITFTGPLLAMSHCFLSVRSDIYFNSRSWEMAFHILQFVAACRVTFSSIVIILMQTHLFVWTVFAPKWIYEFFSFLLVITLFILLA